MPLPTLISLVPDSPLALKIVPAMSFDLSFEHPGQDDWRLWDLRCEVRLGSEAVDAETDPLISLSSDDDTITVAQTDEEITASGDRYQLITLRFSSAQTRQLAELQIYKYDVLGFLIADPTICVVVFPRAELHTLERVTRV